MPTTRHLEGARRDYGAPHVFPHPRRSCSCPGASQEREALRQHIHFGAVNGVPRGRLPFAPGLVLACGRQVAEIRISRYN